MVFYHIKKSHDQLIIIDGNDIVQIFLDIWEDIFSRSLYCSTICDSIYVRKRYDLPFLQGCLHTCCACRLNTDDFDVWVQKLRKCRDTCSKSAPSDRYQNVIYKRKFLYDLHGDSSLTGCYCRIVKWMDKGISFFFCKGKCVCAGFVIHVAVKDNLRTVTLGALYLDQWCGSWHDNDCFYSIFMCSISNTLGMISCRCSDQTFVPLFVRKCADLVICATHLICTGTLHILWLQINLISRHI